MTRIFTDPSYIQAQIAAAIRIPVREIIMGKAARKEKPNG